MNATRALVAAWRASWGRYLREAQTHDQAAAYRKVAARWAAYWAAGTAASLFAMWLIGIAFDFDEWGLLIVMLVGMLGNAGRALYFHGVLAGRRQAWNEGFAAAQRAEADRTANRVWRSAQRGS